MPYVAVLLTQQGYEELGEALKPYISEGPIGKYIYCKSADQNGSFLDMKFTPALCAETVKDDMLISIPIGFVKFITSASGSLPIGFGVHKGK